MISQNVVERSLLLQMILVIVGAKCQELRNLNSIVTWTINWKRLLALIFFHRSLLK